VNYGKLTIVDRAQPLIVRGKDGMNRIVKRVICKCACGETVTKNKYDVLSGKVESCGCLVKEMAMRRQKPTATDNQQSFL